MYRNDTSRKNNFNSVMSMLSLILQLGITMLVPIVLCTLSGAWLGHRLQAGLLGVVGFFVGSAAGMSACWKLISKMTASWPKSPLSKESLEAASKGDMTDDLADTGIKEDE